MEAAPLGFGSRAQTPNELLDRCSQVIVGFSVNATRNLLREYAAGQRECIKLAH